MNRSQSVPSIGISFPHSIPEPPSPSECGCFDRRPRTPNQNHGSRSPSKRSLLLSAPDHSGSSTLFRVPSFCSTTTDASTTLRIKTLSLRGNAASEYTDAPSYHLASDDTNMGNKRGSRECSRSVFQFFSNSLSSDKGESSQPPRSMSSPTLPSTPESSADTFASSTMLIEPEAAIPSHGSLARSSSVYKTFDTSVLLKDNKTRKHGEAASRPAPRLRQKFSSMSLDSSPTPARPFEPRAVLTLWELNFAQNLEVFDPDGVGVKFGTLWKSQRTCVIFIRHFFCSFCMDYSRSIAEQVSPDTLEEAGVKLVVISNGSPAMIKSYKRIFNFPFQVYTDPSLSVYRALGMTLRTLNGGPDSQRGQYVRHGRASGIAMVVRKAVKAHMPIHKKGGDIRQLGGEFVLGPGLSCSYASRMRNTRSHVPILDVLSAAGIEPDPGPIVTLPQKTYSQEDLWMEEREAELNRMHERKGLRRGFMSGGSDCDELACEIADVFSPLDGSDGEGYHSDS